MSESLCTCPTPSDGWHPISVRAGDPTNLHYCRLCGLEMRPKCSCGAFYPRYGSDIGICPEEVHYRDDKDHQPMSGLFIGWENPEVVIRRVKVNKWHPRHWWYVFRCKFWPYPPANPDNMRET